VPGWHDANRSDWWPGLGGMALRTGPGAARTLTVGDGYDAIAFLPDGRLAVAGAKGIRLLDPAVPGPQAQDVAVPLGNLPAGGALGFTFSPGGTRLAVQSRHRSTTSTMVVDVGTGGVLRQPFESDGTNPRAIPAFLDEDRVLLPGEGSWLVLWNLRSAQGSKLIETSALAVLDVAAGGDRLAASALGRRNSVVVWSVDGKELSRITVPVFSDSLSMSPDGRVLITGGSGSGLRMFDVATGQEVWSQEGIHNFGRGPFVGWSADGRLAALAGNGAYVYVWTAAVPGVAYRFPLSTSSGRVITRETPAVAVSADGRQLAVLDGNDSVSLWDLSKFPDLRADPTTAPAR
jgi:hypothetical protein